MALGRGGMVEVKSEENRRRGGGGAGAGGVDLQGVTGRELMKWLRVAFWYVGCFRERELKWALLMLYELFNPHVLLHPSLPSKSPFFLFQKSPSPCFTNNFLPPPPGALLIASTTSPSSPANFLPLHPHPLLHPAHLSFPHSLRLAILAAHP